jgi:ribonuclease P protein subunit RPR2
MKKKHNKKPIEQRKIALSRVKKLFKEADSAFSENPSLSNRYVTLARKIAMKFKLKMPSELKKKYCKHCYKYLKPGENCRVRIRDNKVIYYCQNCKKYSRFPYK